MSQVESNIIFGAVPAANDAGVRYLQRIRHAAAAVLEGRLSEAHRLILDLLTDSERPVTPGQCRYCGCTDEHGCAIATEGGIVVRCSWWDEALTVCSKLSCIARYEREQGSGVGNRDEDAAPRIVVP